MKDWSRAIFTSSRQKCYAKFWLEPIELAESRGFRSADLRELHNLIEQHRLEFIVAWDEHFNQ